MYRGIVPVGNVCVVSLMLTGGETRNGRFVIILIPVAVGVRCGGTRFGRCLFGL